MNSSLHYSDGETVSLRQEIISLGISFWAMVQNVSPEVPWGSTSRAFSMVATRKMQ